jgi:hypothetical protein
MNSQSIFILTALVFSFLVFSALGLSTILTPTTTYAQDTDDSGTSTEQDIRQKNVCSGWTICVNEGTNSEEASIAEETQTLLATPN